MSAIEVQSLQKSFGRVEAVKDVSFTVGPGEFVGLVGHNGAGKSTTIKVLCGQLVPTAGAVRIGGLDVASDPAGARAKMGVVPENPSLYEYLTAREMLEFVVDIRGGGDIDEALALTGLGADADRLIGEYSQGMRRKTALACAMVAKPAVLILDEALNGLDPPSASRVTKALKKACEDGAAVLLSTHVLDTLERIADRLVMLDHGEVGFAGSIDDLDEVRKRFDALAD